MNLARFTPIIGLFFMFLTSCVETHQDYYINENGAGKVKIEATMAQGGQMDFKSNNKGEGNTEEDREKMVEKVKKIVNKSEGIEAWKDVTYELDAEGRIVFKGTAYFPDIRKIDLEEIPQIPVTEYNEDRIRWTMEGMDSGEMDFDQMSREKSDKTEKQADLSEEEVQEIMTQMKSEYSKFSKIMGMAMRIFEVEATYHFPYKIKDVTNMEQVDKRAAVGRLDGDEILNGYDDLMEDEERLKKLIREEGVREFNSKDPRIMEAAYPDKQYKQITFRTGLFSGGPEPPLDYEEEVSKISPKTPEITMP